MVSGSLARTARRAVRGAAAERPLPVRVLVIALMLLAVAAAVCLKPVDRAEASAPPPASGPGAAAVHVQAGGLDAPDDERYCSKQKTTPGQPAPSAAPEAPSTLVPATLAPPPRVPAARTARDEIGPAPPESRHILLSVLRI